MYQGEEQQQHECCVAAWTGSGSPPLATKCVVYATLTDRVERGNERGTWDVGGEKSMQNITAESKDAYVQNQSRPGMEGKNVLE